MHTGRRSQGDKLHFKYKCDKLKAVRQVQNSAELHTKQTSRYKPEPVAKSIPKMTSVGRTT